MLSKLPEIPVIVDSIFSLDDTKLTKVNIDALVKLYPTADELKAIEGLKKARFAPSHRVGLPLLKVLAEVKWSDVQSDFSSHSARYRLVHCSSHTGHSKRFQ